VRQASQKQAQGSGFTRHLSRALREGTLFIVGAISLYLLIALLTYHASDPGWSYSGPTGEVRNTGGVAGAWFADISLYLFGYMAFLFPVLIAYGGWLATRRTLDGSVDWPHLTLRLIGFVITMAAGSSLARLHFENPTLAMPLNAGGVLGDVVGGALVGAFSFFGATIFLLALFLTGVTLATGLSWVGLMEQTGRHTLGFFGWLHERSALLRESLVGRQARRDREITTRKETRKRSKRAPTRIEPIVKKIEPSDRVEREKQVPLFQPEGKTLPPLALLNGPSPTKGGYSAATLEALSRQVELKLRDFGIEVEVEAVHPGPVITRFELTLAAGTKVSRISNLAKDLARALSVISVRIVEVIPGKPVIGLEIPNEHRETVVLSEILNSKTFDKAAGPLTLALGKDISGNPFVAELSKMPHLLVAGTTGSGKSVALNALILSLLYKQSPEHVRLIMIDPKMLELSVYDGIGHLLTPVVTDMKEAGNALRWCIAEMERRYRLMASLGVRNIAGYNRKVREAEEKGMPLTDPLFNQAEYPDEEPPELESLAYIVVIVDEFADMMMVVGKKVEELIARLAQKARAAGIHLILATQRPSVDVITGLIKANIPTRIAFQVSSRIDSRTILDQQGAEQLLGQGDMLYLPPGSGIPHRIHGAFVADEEVHKVVRHLRTLSEPVYVDSITDGSVDIPGLPGENGHGNGDSAESDPLYDQAVAIIAETRRASVSGIQRRLKVGYNRAARMVEAMEQAGVVSPLEANGQREVLIPPPPKG